MPPEIRIPGVPPIKTEDLLRAFFGFLPVLIIILGMTGSPLGSSGLKDDEQIIIYNNADTKLANELTQKIADSTLRNTDGLQVTFELDSDLASDAQSRAGKAADADKLPRLDEETYFVKKIKDSDKHSADEFFDAIQKSKAYTTVPEGTIVATKTFGVGAARDHNATYVIVKFEN